MSSRYDEMERHCHEMIEKHRRACEDRCQPYFEMLARIAKNKPIQVVIPLPPDLASLPPGIYWTCDKCKETVPGNGYIGGPLRPHDCIR